MQETQTNITLDRARAWGLLCEYTQNESLRKHMLAVEACMRAYARKFAAEGIDPAADEDKYGVVGLLHDFDYEKFPTPAEHPFVGSKILEERGYPEEIRRAILSHADYANLPRQSPMEKALFACDELHRAGEARKIAGRGGSKIGPQKNER